MAAEDERRENGATTAARDAATGPSVVGMGEHMPDFLTRSFKVQDKDED